MRLKKFDLDKPIDAKAFQDTLEKISNFQGYKKQLKRTLKTLKSGWVDFYFFNKFHFGSRRLPCFFFGELDEEPWKTLIEGGRLEYTVDEETFVKESSGWEADYKSAKGKAKRVRKGEDGGQIVYLKVRGGKTIMRAYEEDLEQMFMEVFGASEGSKKFVDFKILGEEEEEDEQDLMKEANEAVDDDKALIALLKQEIKDFNAVDIHEFELRMEEIEDMEELVNEFNQKYADEVIPDRQMLSVVTAITANIKRYRKLEAEYLEIGKKEKLLDKMISDLDNTELSEEEYEKGLEFIRQLEEEIENFSNEYYKTKTE